MKILNLYCGLGGNRKNWTGSITAVEKNAEIAAIYKKHFPDDEVIVGDAHQYLLDNYSLFDFIWSSPPCPRNSRARFWSSKGGRYAVKFPDMRLWQEITFLQHFYKGKYCVEHITPYYKPYITPTYTWERHMFWSNFKIKPYELDKVQRDHNFIGMEMYGFDLSDVKIAHRKDQLVRNCVNPDLGAYILEQANGSARVIKTETDWGFFNEIINNA